MRSLAFGSILVAVAASHPLAAQAPVVINEFAYDDASTDDREFVELFNRSGATVDVSGWVVACSDSLGPNPSYTIPPATFLAAGDYYVLGSALVPGVDQVIGTTNLFENDQEAIVLRDAFANVVDAVVYEASTGSWPAAPAEGRPIFGAFLSSDTLPTSWSRLRDGYDTDDNALDFRIMPATSGASNDVASVVPFNENFDALAIDSPAPLWSGSDAPPYVVDPSVPSAQNPKVVPPSPQGGNSMVFSAPSGAGNGRSWMLVSDAEATLWYSAQFYFDAPAPTNPADTITWSLGLRGTTGSRYVPPDPDRLGAVDQNGDTGLSWTYRATATGSTLWLIDNHAGGTSHFVLARIQDPAPGWHQLSFNAANGRARAFFDGVEYGAPIHQTAGGVYFGVVTSTTGGAALAAYVDDSKSKKIATITVSGDPACLGNCPFNNAHATTVATEPPVGVGRYAFQVIPTKGAFSAAQLCFRSGVAKPSGTLATVAIHGDSSGAPSAAPLTATNGGAPYSLTATFPAGEAKGPEWLLASPTGGPWIVPSSVTSFFIVIDVTERIHVPICDEVSEGQIAEIDYLIDTGSGWDRSQAPAAWAWRWLCDPQNDATNDWQAVECALGSTITNVGGGGPPSSIALSALSTLQFVPPLDLAVLGLPTCSFYPANPILSLVFGSPFGEYTYAIAVPNDPTLSGIEVFSQWIFFDPFLPFPLNLSVSPRAAITVH